MPKILREPAKKQDSGFTLIELLLVVSIIAILMAIIFVSFTQVLISSRDAQRKSDLQTIAGSLQRFYSDYSQYPEDSQNKIEYWSTSCIDIGVGSGTNIVAEWGTNGLVCNSRTYIRQFPKDPIGTVEYCYFADPEGSANRNQRFELYARLERSTGSTYTPATCNLPPGQSYNYRITSSD